MLAGVVSSIKIYEDTLTLLVDNGAMTANTRPRGTMRQVLDWYVDAINLGVMKLNSDAEAFSPGETELPLFNF